MYTEIDAIGVSAATRCVTIVIQRALYRAAPPARSHIA
jgi:hypothetical protein